MIFDELTYEQMNVPKKYWDVVLDEQFFPQEYSAQVKKLKKYVDEFEEFRYKHGLLFCAGDQNITTALAIGSMFRFWDSPLANTSKFPVYLNYLNLPKVLEQHKKYPDVDDLWNRINRAELLVIGNFKDIELQFDSEKKFLIQTVSNLIELRAEDAKPTFLLTPYFLYDEDEASDYELEDFVENVRKSLWFLLFNKRHGV